MTASEAHRVLRRLALKFKVFRLTEIKLSAIGLGLLTFALVRLVLPYSTVAALAGILMLIAVLIARIIRTGALQWDELKVALFLNRSFPSLKDSADLLVDSKALSGLEVVQRQYVLEQLPSVREHVRIPNRIGQGLSIFIVGVVAVLALPAAMPVSKQRMMSREEVVQPTGKAILPAIAKVSLRITPPVYTRIKAHSSDEPNIKAPVNSLVEWTITFHGEPVNPAIVVSGQDIMPLKQSERTYGGSRRMQQRAFYQIVWNDVHGKHYTTDFFQVDVREDLPPVVEIVGRDQFQEVRPGDPMQMEVRTRISDDYSVTNAHLIATVSKGSGESVKFREEKLLFENAARLPGRQVELTRQIDLQKLGLEPGDELYFYAEAMDNRAPSPNVSRTETFFIALQDTAAAAVVADSGLGVDLMPEYFRSQRQIIIDTEKLLAEQRRIRKQEFNSRSNELGYDQKTLRLRYGQFLGEEDEAGIGVASVQPEHEEEEEEEDPLKKFGHQHDTKNEHNLVQEKKTDNHQHATEEEEKEGPMKAFIHQHDNEEEATFFVLSVKAKLKAALTLMWESELQLRMYEPKKSLPVQYKILKLLKEIAQDSRVYVHRSGFDPPPIKEERRLSGDLDEVASTTERTQSLSVDTYPGIQAALAHIEELLQQSTPVISANTSVLATNAGYEVATEELKQPGRYIQTLSDLRKLADGSIEPAKQQSTLRSIRQAFWNILPVATWSPTRGKRTLHPLDKAVLDQLEKAPHE